MIFTKIKNYAELQKEYNTLLNQYEILEELVKEEVIEKLFSNADKDIKLSKLEAENRNLRKKIKMLKEIIKNG